MTTELSRRPAARSRRRLHRMLASIGLAVAIVATVAWAGLAPASAATGVALVNPASGRCLDITGGPNAPSGSAAEIWDCNSQTNQAWTFTTAGELRTQNGTQCLDAYNNQTANGTKLTSYTCNNGANQKFTLHTNGTITGNQSGRCLDITGAATTNGTPVTLWDCTNQPNQTWTRR